MKKSLFFVGLLMALSLSVSAQNNGFSFGFKVGPGFDWTGSTTGAAVSKGARVGMGLGVIAEYYFADNYAVVTGVNVNLLRGHYSFKEGTLDTVTNNLRTFDVDRYYKSTVYEIPIMLKMVTNELGELPLRVYAQVGAGIGYAQNVKVKDSYQGYSSETYGPSNKEYSNFRTSLKIGAGAQYALDESTRLFAGVYFSHDFINNINYISPNYYKYYGGSKQIGERDVNLNMIQNRFGIEVGILF